MCDWPACRCPLQIDQTKTAAVAAAVAEVQHILNGGRPRRPGEPGPSIPVSYGAVPPPSSVTSGAQVQVRQVLFSSHSLPYWSTRCHLSLLVL